MRVSCSSDPASGARTMHSLASEGPGNEGSAHGCLQVKWRAFGPLESRGAKTFESHGPKVKAQCVRASTHGGHNSPRRRALAACRCPEPTACSRYPAIQGCWTRSTRSCGSRRTTSRAVCRRPSSSSRAGYGILIHFTQTCNSKLILALR